MHTIVLCKTCLVALDIVDLPSPLLLLYFTTENLVLRLTTGLDEKSDNFKYVDVLEKNNKDINIL